MVESILRILKQLHPEHTDAELAEIKRKLHQGRCRRSMRIPRPAWCPISSPGASPTGWT
jgi:uncharacterized Fe-S radical SAM superfamily protein PflX